MEKKGSYWLQIIIFFAVCLALCGGVWYGLDVLEEYREEYDFIVNERDNFSVVMDGLRAKNKTLQGIHKINLGRSETVPDDIEFYSEVRKLIDANNVELIERSTNDNGILTLKLQGGYYSCIKLFADWRAMPFISRMTSLKITRDKDSPDNFVFADVTLEAWRP